MNQTQQSKPPGEDPVNFGYGHARVPRYLILLYAAFALLLVIYVLRWLVPAWWSLEHHATP